MLPLIFKQNPNYRWSRYSDELYYLREYKTPLYTLNSATIDGIDIPKCVAVVNHHLNFTYGC